MPAEPTITLYPDGPLVVRGDIEIRDAEGAPVDTGRDRGLAVALCRCGKSARKPLCDGSHKRTGRRSARADG